MIRTQLIAYITGVLTLTGTLVGLSLWTGSIDPETGYPEPITVDGKTIEFTWTDDNTGEDLIIYTDKATYTNGISHAEVYIALHNNSGIKQNVSFGGYFRDSSKKVAELSVLTEVTEEFSETVQVEDCKRPRDYISTTSPSGEMVDLCTVFKDQTNTWQETSLRWVPLPQESRDPVADATNLAKTGAVRKSTEDFIADKVANYEMAIGEIVYFKALVQFPPNADDNFYFEAVGSEGAFGNLDPWFDAGWDYKVKIEVNPDYVDSTLTNYPLYVDLADMPSTFKDNILANGADIRVLESDESTETAFEIVNASTTASYGEMHILVDSLSSSATTTLYIYYGNATATAYAVGATYGRNAVWSDYARVTHMKDLTTSTLTDSTGNDTVPKAGANLPYETPQGFGDRGQIFIDSATDYADFNTVVNLGTVTYQAWVNISNYAVTTIDGYYLAKRSAATNGAVELGNIRPGGTDHVHSFSLRIGSGWRSANCPETAISTGTPYHVVGTYDGSNVRCYSNGVVGTALAYSGTIANLAVKTRIGQNPSFSTYRHVGEISEARIRSGALSADWIDAEYTNHATPSTFYFVGVEQTNTVPEDPTYPTTIYSGNIKVGGGIIVK